MDVRSSLGEFLQAKRARLRPGDVGLPRYGDRRRVPGLRREELAMLAGVSAGYYARLEQGLSLHASREVLDAIAGAMRLTAAEREHLHVLSSLAGHRVNPAPPPTEHAAAGLNALLAAMPGVPALVTGRRNDVLAWNRAGHALFAGHLPVTAPDHPDTRPNLSRMVFLDAHTRGLYRDWERKARAVVGNLRAMTARNPGDTGLAALVGELAIESPDFARLWAEHTVTPCGSDVYELAHPLVGDLTVTQNTLTVTQEPHQSLITITAEAGSSSAAALTMLRQACGG
ncbi:helix-turn-helix domain-containing protein [Catenuloplanes atrovinosus]|uniref:Transcriptional regulator with XRE-family HTH domain n=1 Tax=Catenuloplanes atrovinosus TaxID=137266 RepID=A0AAE3YR63_9ACTN|nr:helix-turn-helix transcriptional regulator [Catenuloplanes atrovinosus]MDR7277142.1 transcriptional regulator with XRE-family HTH domain [Catenuloplanes atrovinosus]